MAGDDAMWRFPGALNEWGWTADMTTLHRIVTMSGYALSQPHR